MRDLGLVRDGVSLNRLLRMQPDQAAALLRDRQTEAVAGSNVLKRWLAIDAANRVAWADVNAAWNDFDDGDDDEILIAMRVDARRAAKRRAKEDGR